ERLLQNELETAPDADTRALARGIERLAIRRRAESADSHAPDTRSELSSRESAPTPAGLGADDAIRWGRPDAPRTLSENRLVTVLFIRMNRPKQGVGGRVSGVETESSAPTPYPRHPTPRAWAAAAEAGPGAL